MKRFKNIILGLQAQSKASLSWLYVDSYTKDPNLTEDEKVFSQGSLDFWFQGTGRRNAERVLMMVAIPMKAPGNDAIPMGTYLLTCLEPVIRAWSEDNKNDNKAREKAQFFVQASGNRMLRRSGMSYDAVRERFVLRMLFQVPLINAVSVNGKAAYRGVAEILELIEGCVAHIDGKEMENYIRTYRWQCEIRRYLREHGLCAFVANGSILPREKDSNNPMQGAIPFVSPKECEVTIELECAGKTVITGMGIPNGITVITGGGYSGKSTLLDALEAGIYDHVPGDGREFVLADRSALKVYAEDGRPVSMLDLSAFFKFLPGKPLEEFCTPHASGSVSQASNIIEAVGGGSKLLLIDEDKSATNFMIRDQIMRLIVEDEPIIPFTERVKELWKEKGVSTILVIGGSSEYLHLADQVILMKDFCPRMITGAVKKLVEAQKWKQAQELVEAQKLKQTQELVEAQELKQVKELVRPKGFVQTEEESSLPGASWQVSRRLLVKETSQPFLFFRTVETENEKKVILDEYSADVTMLTALSTHEQLCTVTVAMERLLTDPSGKNREVLENVREFLEDLFVKGKTGSIMPETQSWFYEEIRPLDALCCINRMRGATFLSRKDPANSVGNAAIPLVAVVL